MCGTYKVFSVFACVGVSVGVSVSVSVRARVRACSLRHHKGDSMSVSSGSPQTTERLPAQATKGGQPGARTPRPEQPHMGRLLPQVLASQGLHEGNHVPPHIINTTSYCHVEMRSSFGTLNII